MRELRFLFQEPGMLEAVASDPLESEEGAECMGYSESGIPDFMVDRDAQTRQPYAWMCYNFDKSYPSVIWGLRQFMSDELFNVPQANLTAVPLHVAFSWAYYHFILEDGALLPSRKLVIEVDPTDYTRLVLAHSLAMAS